MMPDKEQAVVHDQPVAAAAEKRTRFSVIGKVPREALLVAVGACALIWGTWATHAILTIERSAPRLVKVELADLVREYVQGEARSGAAPDQITAQTATFLKALGEAVGAHAHRGEIVLLSNAVVDGAVPDITRDVRGQVYSHVARIAPGQPQGLSPQMQAYFQQNGANGGNGK
jgi:hypothetical protein